MGFAKEATKHLKLAYKSMINRSNAIIDHSLRSGFLNANRSLVVAREEEIEGSL